MSEESSDDELVMQHAHFDPNGPSSAAAAVTHHQQPTSTTLNDSTDNAMSSSSHHLYPSTVAETLLAFAKDHRYVLHCQSLLKQILASSSYDESETFWAACLLYYTTTTARTNRTLGMEYCGLQYHHSNCNTPTAVFQSGQCRTGMVLAKRLLLSVSWMILVRQVWNKRRQRQITPSSTTFASRSELVLRGQARRDFHVQQQHAMLERSRAAAAGNTSSGSSAAANDENIDYEAIRQPERASSTWPSSAASTSSLLRITRARLKDLLHRTAGQFLQALQDDPEGPHNIESTEGQTSSFSVVKWMVRLNLAHYCLTANRHGDGGYPTLLHRLLGTTTTTKKQRAADGALPHRILTEQPASLKIVGNLIFLQAGIMVVKAVAAYLAEQQQHVSNESIPDDSTASSLYPSSSSSLRVSTRNVCSICRMPRMDHAASSKCGHVFCWKCLYQWTVRTPECPVCRVPCRPQEILALYQYEA